MGMAWVITETDASSLNVLPTSIFVFNRKVFHYPRILIYNRTGDKWILMYFLSFFIAVWYFILFIYFLSYHFYSHAYPLFGPLHHPSPPTPSSRQNLFHPLVLWFCWREIIRDNKKDIVFWLIWDKDSCTERVLVLLSHTCVLQPTLALLCQTSIFCNMHRILP
jgi:hypothetical protein